MSGKKHAIKSRRSMLLRGRNISNSNDSSPYLFNVADNSGADVERVCAAVPRMIAPALCCNRWGCDVTLRFVNLLCTALATVDSRIIKQPCARGPVKNWTREFVIELYWFQQTDSPRIWDLETSPLIGPTISFNGMNEEMMVIILA